MGFRGVFFDFDYTLGDATDAIVAGFRYGFAQMGLAEPEREAVRHTVGMTLEDGYTALTGDNRPEQRARFRQLYTEKVSTKRTDTLTAVLEARGVRQYLVSLTGGDKVDRPKPDPQGLLPYERRNRRWTPYR